MKKARCDRRYAGVRLPVPVVDPRVGGWRRVLALWGFAPVPFFKASGDEKEEYAVRRPCRRKPG